MDGHILLLSCKAKTCLFSFRAKGSKQPPDDTAYANKPASNYWPGLLSGLAASRKVRVFGVC